MSFGAPGFLFWLLAVLIAAAAAAFGLRWRAHARARFGVRSRAGVLPYAAAALGVLAIALAAFAAARPQAGSRTASADERGIDLVIVLDVSQSMLSSDAAPTRLGRAQAEIGALLDRLQGDRVGLIIFAGEPFVRAPLTGDLRALHRVVDGVDAERGLVAAGSDLGAAIRGGQALLAKGNAQTRAVLIVSDGEDHGAGVGPAVEAARGAGIRVYTAGAGTAAGAPVVDIDPNSRLPQFRLDGNGQRVITRLDAPALRTIAAAANGRYIELSGDGHPLAALAPEFASLPATEQGEKPISTPIERFQIFAAIALLVLCIELVLPSAVARPRQAFRMASRLWPLAGAGLLVGAICSQSAAEVNRHGNELYDRQQFGAAIDQYGTAEAIEPARPQIAHNAGNAYDRTGDYDRAIAETIRALNAGGDIRALAEYALGNHYAGAQRLDDAREAYKRALLANPDDADAKHNLEIIDQQLRATPVPSPTPAEIPTPTPQRGAGPPQGTPPAGDGSPGPTTPVAGQGTPSDAAELTPDEIQRRLQDALAGIDKEVTPEEANRILDLLDRANDQSSSEPRRIPGRTDPPDY